MKLSIGRWVTGEEFFDRKYEAAFLETQIKDGNHNSLSGQRRMGKISIARQVGLSLEKQGWLPLVTDVEDPASPEDVIAEIAEKVHPIQSIAKRFGDGLGRAFSDKMEEVSALQFRLKVRATLNESSGQRHGDQLIAQCAEHEQPVFLVIDELPIFLKRLRDQDDGQRRADEFLSWPRRAAQSVDRVQLVFFNGAWRNKRGRRPWTQPTA
jgi:hypothetical protein